MQRLINPPYTDFSDASVDSGAISDLAQQHSFAELWRALDPSPSTTIEILPRIEDALKYVRSLNLATNNGGHGGAETQVLITGSLHLVGRALGALEGVNAL